MMPVNDTPRSSRHQFIARMILLPLFLYFILFSVLTYPLIAHAATDCYCNHADGYQYVWKLWWVNKAVTEYHQSPWETSYLYYPTGIHLIVDDLDTLNGLIGIVLLRFVALPQVYNLLMIAGFVVSGMTMFWLAYYFTSSYSASLLAGVIFTFSNYHFAHADLGHLTTLTMYWLPLFVLCWYRFLERPNFRRAIYTALVLWALTLTHLYFLFYAVLIGFMIVLWKAVIRRDLLFPLRHAYLRPMITFVVLTLLVLGPYITAYVVVNHADSIVVDPFGTDDAAGHQAKDYSVDVLALFIPAGRTATAILSGIAGYPVSYTYAEHNAYPGWIVWGAIVILAIRWRKWDQDKTVLGLWYALLIIFIVISFGPILHIAGSEIAQIPMPYTLLERVIPLFGSSGTPGRITVMSILCAAMIAAFGFKMILQNYRDRPLFGKAITGVLLVVLAIDYLPLDLPITPTEPPPFVQVLRDQPDQGALIDGVTLVPYSTYYQTIHNHPIAFAYTARVTESVRQGVRQAKALLDAGNYVALCEDYGYRYLVVAPTVEVKAVDGKPLYRDATIALYELTCPF